MKAYELPIQVSDDGEIKLPESLLRALPADAVVRVIVLVNEPDDPRDQGAWARLTAEQFLAGYSDEDSIYDRA